MLSIEFEVPTRSECECCKSITTRLTRFVYKDNDAFAVYYAQFTQGHSRNYLSGIIGLGEWGDDNAGPETRAAFPFIIRLSGEKFQVELVDAADSPWSHVTFLGRIMDRKEALAHAWIKDVFHLTDHMVLDDQEIVNHFA